MFYNGYCTVINAGGEFNEAFDLINGTSYNLIKPEKKT